MYVGVIFYRFKPDSMDDAVKDWEDMVMREAKREIGFIRAEMFINDETGEGLDIGYWDTEEDARRFEEKGLFDLMAEEMKDHMSEKPRREQFKVVSSV